MQKLRSIFLIAFGLAALFNLGQAYLQAVLELQDRTTIPLHSLSYQFMGLENVFKGERTVGYYTDKDLNNTLAIAQFEQAQYVLAPTVLDLNHTEHRWVIVDCTSAQAGMDAIKHLGLTPVKMNRGLILALNPNGN
jgi:hypothetical protein